MRIFNTTDFSELIKSSIKYSVDLSKDVDIQLYFTSRIIDTMHLQGLELVPINFRRP